VLLLDEPLSNLDAKLRIELRSEIRRICKESGITTIYVTHDQKEALSIADRVAIVSQGRIVQMGPPAALYRSPRSKFVAEFLGETNFLPGTVLGADGGATVRVQTTAGMLRSSMAEGRTTGDRLTVSVRPEALHMADAAHAAQMAPDAPALRGTVAETVYLGEMAQHRVECAGAVVKVFEMNPRRASRRGEAVVLTADPEQVVLLAG
jgi:iron(III) transport system ATP-binding protein